jgi:hypothetical protein
MSNVGNVFGTDIWASISSSGQIDIDPSARETGGIQVLVQSLVMRQTTPLGSLLGAPDDGIDLRNLLSKGMTLAQIQEVGGTVRAQLLRDPRVQGAVVTPFFNQATNTLTLNEQIQSSAGPFVLVISVNQLTITTMLNGVVLGAGT